MIIGIGIDLVESERIEKIRLLDAFEKKYFTNNEQLFFASKNNCVKNIANNFAVKEAFSKALGTGVRGFSLNEVEVLRNEFGKPYINLYGNAKNICDKLRAKNIFVSITDTTTASAAVVVIEG